MKIQDNLNWPWRKKSLDSELNGRQSESLSKLPFPPFYLVDTIDFNWLPLYKNKFFLHQKYVVERLSTREIADLVFSSKSVVLQYLRHFDIPVRDTGVQIRRKTNLRYGSKIQKRREVQYLKEVENIKKMKELRSKGFTYERIADVFNSMKIPTKTGRGIWHRKTIQAIVTA